MFSDLELTKWEKEDLEEIVADYPEILEMSDEEIDAELDRQSAEINKASKTKTPSQKASEKEDEMKKNQKSVVNRPAPRKKREPKLRTEKF